jgi:hypothetical protein
MHFELILVQGEGQGPSFSPAAFIEEAVFSPLCVLGSFVGDQLAIDTWVYIWILYSDPLVFLSLCQYQTVFIVMAL